MRRGHGHFSPLSCLRCRSTVEKWNVWTVLVPSPVQSTNCDPNAGLPRVLDPTPEARGTSSVTCRLSDLATKRIGEGPFGWSSTKPHHKFPVALPRAVVPGIRRRVPGCRRAGPGRKTHCMCTSPDNSSSLLHWPVFTPDRVRVPVGDQIPREPHIVTQSQSSLAGLSRGTLCVAA
jgi:hypothetical protein